MSLQTFAAQQYQASLFKILIYLAEGKVPQHIMPISSVMRLVVLWELPVGLEQM